ncbi:PLP-dependent transferase [Aspergillus uvarum CBS 121591]|uniref:PLP-dependent transferase n=1 Tax=Aspergillus uvarum CBS 121591 TaxID=1448315 RepID=A0A319C6E6_9EURO|nr:PLP-dependent transferase [Aspergillus uvarum CBS 121591]PYH79469.1 PLP-dependent transferase [Aspergillus uvarum CBS 121591]
MYILQISLDLTAGEAENPFTSFLQYGSGAGDAQLRQRCRDFTQHVHRPLCENFDILLHPGNTNAWSKVISLLCERGDYILCEEFTYPSAQACWVPLGNYAAPVAMDAQGFHDDSLESTLAEWELNHPDIIIVEDDPYFFLQFPEYELNSKTTNDTSTSNEQFLASLAPSFLQIDYQGRAIRLESFSKTLAPGLRLGYFIARPFFIQRLLLATEVETQDPSGLWQAVVLSLLQTWGLDGYQTWLQSLRDEYQARRDWMIRAFQHEFTLVSGSQHSELDVADSTLVAVLDAVPIFSFVPPTGGMFIWAQFHLHANPTFRKMRDDQSLEDSEDCFAEHFWEIPSKVLLTPGSYYHPWQGEGKVTTQARGAKPTVTKFRFSFSMTTREEMERGIARLAKVVRASWEL